MQAKYIYHAIYKNNKIYKENYKRSLASVSTFCGSIRIPPMRIESS